MLAIYCAECKRMVGSITAPTSAELMEAAKESPFSAMLGLLPPDVTETIAQLCTFKCPIHTMLGESEDASTKAGEENDGQEQPEADPLDAEADARRAAEQRHRSNFLSSSG